MSRFTFITDLHFKLNSPKYRTGNYVDDLCDKLNFVVNKSKAENVDAILVGGDISHSPSVEDSVINRFADIVADSGLQWYVIPGNHDIVGKNHQTYKNTRLGLLKHYSNFHVLDKRVKVENCYIHGIKFSNENECGKDFQIKRGKGVNIAIHHGMIADKKKTVGGHDVIVDYKEINTNADVFLSGHYHYGYMPDMVNNTWFANPGSFARVNISDYKYSIGYGMAIIEAPDRSDVRIEYVKLPYRKCRRSTYKKAQYSRIYDNDEFMNAFKELEKSTTAIGNLTQYLKKFKTRSAYRAMQVIEEECNEY